MRASRHACSSVVLSFFHPKEDLALKFPRIIVKRELDDAVVFEMSSKFDKNSSNLAVSWLGDLYITPIYPLQFCIVTSQIVHSFRFVEFNA